MIRTLVVDDEPLARERLRTLLAAESDIEVVAECTNGREAVRELTAQAPQLLFLDIKMPELDGFGVVDEIQPANMPATVFVTAYSEFALKAFDCHAIDYLLKPFDRVRFRSALEQVRRRLASDSSAVMSERLAGLIEDYKARENYAERLVVKSARRLIFLEVATIDWIDAAGNYVRLNAGGKQYRVRDKISALESRLDPKRFLRIHRSTIVNTEAIREIQSLPHGEGLVKLADGQLLSMSRTYRERLDGFIA